MDKKYLAQVVHALLNDKVDEAIIAAKSYYILKMRQIVERDAIKEDTENEKVPFKIRKDYARAYQRHYNRHLNSKQAQADAYDDVIRRHGKEAHDQLKDYHQSHLREQQAIMELSKKIMRSYHKKSLSDIEDKAYNLGAMEDKSSKAFDKAANKLNRRRESAAKVVDKMVEIASKTIGSEIIGQEHTHEVIDKHTGKSVGKYRSSRKAHHAADKKDLQYGAIRYGVRPIKKEQSQ